MKQKILKIKVGEIFIKGESIPVFATAWEKKSKDGKKYYETTQVIFENEIEVPDKENKENN